MTYLAIYLEPTRAIVVSDTAVFENFRITSFRSKPYKLRHGLLAARGWAEVHDRLAADLMDLPFDLNEPDFPTLVLGRSIEASPDAVRVYSMGVPRPDGSAYPSPCEAVLVGWSERRNRMCAIVADAKDTKPARLLDDGVTQLHMGWSARPIHQHGWSEKGLRDYLAKLPDNTDQALRSKCGMTIFGGHVEFTTVNRDGSRTERVGRFTSLPVDAASITRQMDDQKRAIRDLERIPDLAERIRHALAEGLDCYDAPTLALLHARAVKWLSGRLAAVTFDAPDSLLPELVAINRRIDSLLPFMESRDLAELRGKASAEGLSWLAERIVWTQSLFAGRRAA